jgi:hypothetical protein
VDYNNPQEKPKKGGTVMNRVTRRMKKNKKAFEAMRSEELMAEMGRMFIRWAGRWIRDIGIERIETGCGSRQQETQGVHGTGFAGFQDIRDVYRHGASRWSRVHGGPGIDIKGQKKALGLWEGATENTEVAKSLLSDLRNRGLALTKEAIFVTDGGGGIIRAIKDLFGNELIHQRCTIHKDRNIQSHLPKKYRREAHRRFTDAMDLKTYEDAKESLMAWLGEINESSVKSLEEAEEGLLTLHRLKVPELLRKTLHSTNPAESTFSTVRFCEKNIKRCRGSRMSQRWLAAVLLYAEGNFRTVKGYNEIPWVIQRIKLMQKTAEQKAMNQPAEAALVGA